MAFESSPQKLSFEEQAMQRGQQALQVLRKAHNDISNFSEWSNLNVRYQYALRVRTANSTLLNLLKLKAKHAEARAESCAGKEGAINCSICLKRLTPLTSIQTTCCHNFHAYCFVLEVCGGREQCNVCQKPLNLSLTLTSEYGFLRPERIENVLGTHTSLSSKHDVDEYIDKLVQNWCRTFCVVRDMETDVLDLEVMMHGQEIFQKTWDAATSVIKRLEITQAKKGLTALEKHFKEVADQIIKLETFLSDI